MQPRIADFWTPTVYAEMNAIVATSAVAGAVWPAANRAIYTPVIFPYPCTIYSIMFGAVNGTGNYDLGIYDGYTKTKMASSGSVAMSAGGPKTLTFSSQIRVDAGRLYYGALALSSTSGSVFRFAPEIPALIAAGFGQEASALPLNSTMTPATVATAYAPVIVFGVR